MYLKGGIIGLGFLFMTHGAFALSDHDVIRIIVKYRHQIKNNASLKSQISQFIQLPVKEINPMANGAYSLTLDVSAPALAYKITADSTALVLERLRKSPEILYAVKDRIGYFTPVPEPQTFNLNATTEFNTIDLLSHESQWDEFERPSGVMLESKPGFRDGAWAYTTGLGKEPVVVAVLDTGVTLNNSLINNLVKDSKGKVWGWNFAANNNDLTDETKSYHGTHVAGTIAGYGSVMSGMGEDLKVLPVKIPGASGMFYESAVINAIYWSVGGEVPGVPTNIHPAKVLNMSFGVDRGPGDEIDYCDQALQEAVFFARNQGAVLIAAAGNDNRWEHFNAPAVCNGVIKVASTGPEGLRSYFSNYGPGITLAAPGGDKLYGIWGGILSTVNPGGGYHGSGFDYYQGTSMAAPHVAGVTGLLFAVSDKILSPKQIEQILYTTTHTFGVSADPNKSCVGSKPCGHGILDAENAVKATVAYYDVLFSSPKQELLAITACEQGGFTPSEKRVSVGDAVWIQLDKGCELTAKYQNPHIVQKQDGSIIAYYGSVRYKLDQTNYKLCHVIGYDGVGCYL